MTLNDYFPTFHECIFNSQYITAQHSTNKHLVQQFILKIQSQPLQDITKGENKIRTKYPSKQLSTMNISSHMVFGVFHYN